MWADHKPFCQVWTKKNVAQLFVVLRTILNSPYLKNPKQQNNLICKKVRESRNKNGKREKTQGKPSGLELSTHSNKWHFKWIPSFLLQTHILACVRQSEKCFFGLGWLGWGWSDKHQTDYHLFQPSLYLLCFVTRKMEPARQITPFVPVCSPLDRSDMFYSPLSKATKPEAFQLCFISHKCVRIHWVEPNKSTRTK